MVYLIESIFYAGILITALFFLVPILMITVYLFIGYGIFGIVDGWEKLLNYVIKRMIKS